MSVGFVLINAVPALRHNVYNKLSKIPQVLELNLISGEYDLIAKIEAESFEKIGEMVIDEIRAIDGVIDTKTLTGAKLGQDIEKFRTKGHEINI